LTIRLFLDEDVGTDLAPLLALAGDFDVMTTVLAGRANRQYSDESQLEFAAEQNRTLFSFNRADYDRIAKEWASGDKHHAGILTAQQQPPWGLIPGFLQLLALYPAGLPADLCMHLPGA
jgi:hypothetical protein